ncbi:alpha/beta hydrolase [uncultured Thiodictyon sp.]|uniref:alpha/beta fold hydrolase n=1 Tax=uncultured Thiodictyon sp. TaxID=1846217 RepID=UPI0025DE997F|nr:alpha/beta hydrolase [uncultured Thiodictyon sp.]
MQLTPLQHLTLPTGPLAYRQTGSGIPLILIHGWRGASSHWQNTLNALADIRNVYAIDLPGHGATPPGADPLTMQGLARLVIDFADQAGLDRFDLVGHSYGAAVAVVIAARWPERVRRLVLSSMGVAGSDLERFALTQTHACLNLGLPWVRPWVAMMRPWPGPWQPALDWMSGEPATSRAFAGAFLRQLPADQAVVSEGVHEFLSTDPLSSLEIMIDAANPAFAAALAKIAAPVLLLSGDSDLVMPAAGVAALAARLADCRTVLLDDCGHMPMIEWPERFIREVRAFLTDGEVAAAH